MFSAAKARWLLDRLPSGQARAKAAETCIGTINSFILSRFGGEAMIEAGNASRTQLFDVVGGRWDEELLSIFDVPLAAMPRVVASTGPFPAAKGLGALARRRFGRRGDGRFPFRPVRARRFRAGAGQGDARHRLFGDGPGRPQSGQRRRRGRARRLPDARVADRRADAGVRGQYPVRWIDLDLGGRAARRRHTGACAPRGDRRPNSRGVYLVPAFGGLGAPWWDASAVGIVSGVTFGVTRAPLARAALDSIAHQIADVLDAVRASGAPVERLLVDGGPTRNDQLMQFEADMVGVPVQRTDVAELSAMGVAHLAGVSAGLFTLEGLRRLDRGGQAFKPSLRAAGSAARARAPGRAQSHALAVWRFTELQRLDRWPNTWPEAETRRWRRAEPRRQAIGGVLALVSGATGPLIGLVLLCVFLSFSTDTFRQPAQFPERDGSDHGARRDGRRHDARDPDRRHRPFGRLGSCAFRHGDGLSRRQPALAVRHRDPCRA